MKVRFLFALFVTVVAILFSWYVPSNEPVETSSVERVEVKPNKANTLLVRPYNKPNDFVFYYKSTTTYIRTRSNIPFVYNYKIVSKTPVKLYSEPKP